MIFKTGFTKKGVQNGPHLYFAFLVFRSQVGVSSWGPKLDPHWLQFGSHLGANLEQVWDVVAVVVAVPVAVPVAVEPFGDPKC